MSDQIHQPDSQDAPLGGPTAADLGQDRGYIGERTDLHPESAYSQETDPTKSPSASTAIAGAHLRDAVKSIENDPEAGEQIDAALNADETPDPDPDPDQDDNGAPRDDDAT